MRPCWRWPLVAAASLLLSMSGAGWAQAGPAASVADPAPDPGAAPNIGTVQTSVQRSAQRHTLYQEVSGWYGDYSRWKTQVQNQTGLQWSFDATFTDQWGGPNGGPPAPSFLAQLSLSYGLFEDAKLGSGSLQFLGYVNRYLTGQTAAQLQTNLGTATPVSDWPANQNYLGQLSYTQALPGNRLSFTVGQYPFLNFDGNQYLGNSQINFLNYAFAQNGSATYPAAGLGGYAQWNADATVQLAGGFQYPNSATFAAPNVDSASSPAWVAYAQWTPTLNGLGSAQYSLTLYESPATSQQGSSRGWSVNAVQNLGSRWAVFGRANAASGYTTPIQASYAAGVALNNPLQRSATDQIAVAVGLSDVSSAGSGISPVRNETLFEGYWSWTFLGGLLLTPDVQIIMNPAYDPGRASVWVLSLRATLMF